MDASLVRVHAPSMFAYPKCLAAFLLVAAAASGSWSCSSDGGTTSLPTASDGGLDASPVPGPDAGAVVVTTPGDVTCPGDLSAIPFVTPTSTAAPLPAFAGGALKDGDYVLASVTLYGAATVDAECTSPSHGGFAVSGTTLRVSTQRQASGASVKCLREAYTVAGTKLQLTDGALGFTASADGSTIAIQGGDCNSGNSTIPGVLTFVRK